MDASVLARLPRPAFLGTPWLLGLSYRALSEGADPAVAAMTARRIEHLRLQQTEYLKHVSEWRTSQRIYGDKSLSARREAEQAALDLRIFEEQHPPPPRPKGLLKRKPSPEEVEIERQRLEAADLAASLEAEAREIAGRASAAGELVAKWEAQQAQAHDIRLQLEAALRSELSSWVLSLAAAGEMNEARERLEEMRRLLRGELAVAALYTLLDVLLGGLDGLKHALAEMKSIFEQHRDPLPRVLSALAALREGTPAARLDLGLFTRESFTLASHFRLYQLVGVLAGWQPDADELRGDPILPLLQAVRCCLADEAGAGAAVPGVCEQAAVSDPVVLLLLANLLLRRGEAGRVLELLGLEPARFRPVRRRDKPPALLDELAGQGVPLWPAALAPQVHTSLACHALLAAAAAGAGWPWEDWLRQSYGWPKDVLVWWTLGTLKEDPALLRNIAGADQVFFAARPV